MYNNYIFFVNW